MSDIHSKELDELFDAILSLNSTEECYELFEDLCTIAEINAMKQRFQVAKLLDKGQKYGDIGKATGASTATISRVNRCLNYGSGGYKKVIEREKQNANK